MCDFHYLLEKAKKLHSQNITFVVYKYPHSKKVSLGYFFPNKPHRKNTPIFIFAPFENPQKRIELPLENYLEAAINFKNTYTPEKYTPLPDEPLEKKAHIKLVTNTIDFIKKGGAKKVVIATKKKITTEKTFSDIFKRLITQEGFAYVFFHKQTGIWMGVTPELLIEKKHHTFKTVALAGTKPYEKSKNIWHTKEIEEQKIVVKGIVTALKKLRITPNISERKTIRAGHLTHLSTEIKGQTTSQNIFTMLDMLHPTAAVCGLPTKKAQKFIIQNEPFKRSFYTGFLGVIDSQKSTANIFVNLRCLHLENNTATIYAGGGITAKSNPEKEWHEIQLKRQTILRCLFD